MKQKLNNLEIKSFLESSSLTILGVDEVGRGCIAGPVCAGVVIFNLESKSNLSRYVDSKLIKPQVRQVLSDEITEQHQSAIGWSTVEEIDELNIRQASLLAMHRAVLSLIEKYKYKTNKIENKKMVILVDGIDVIPNLEDIKQFSVIKGDQLVRQISAASIIAKVARDHLMKEISIQHHVYGFEKHKGYGTVLHRDAIKKYGITNYHRKTFAGVKEYI